MRVEELGFGGSGFRRRVYGLGMRDLKTRRLE